MLHHGENREESSPSHGQEYARFTHRRVSKISARLALCTAVILGGAGKFLEDVRDVEQPTHVSSGPGTSFVVYGEPLLPSPDEDAEDIMQQLETPERTGEFLCTNVACEMPGFPVEFFQTYRKHPQTLLANRRGA